MYCDLWPYLLWPLDFQIQKRIVYEETIWGNTVFATQLWVYDFYFSHKEILLLISGLIVSTGDISEDLITLEFRVKAESIPRCFLWQEWSESDWISFNNITLGEHVLLLKLLLYTYVCMYLQSLWPIFVYLILFLQYTSYYNPLLICNRSWL